MNLLYMGTEKDLANIRYDNTILGTNINIYGISDKLKVDVAFISTATEVSNLQNMLEQGISVIIPSTYHLSRAELNNLLSKTNNNAQLYLYDDFMYSPFNIELKSGIVANSFGKLVYSEYEIYNTTNDSVINLLKNGLFALEYITGDKPRVLNYQSSSKYHSILCETLSNNVFKVNVIDDDFNIDNYVRINGEKGGIETIHGEGVPQIRSFYTPWDTPDPMQTQTLHDYIENNVLENYPHYTELKNTQNYFLLMLLKQGLNAFCKAEQNTGLILLDELIQANAVINFN